MKVQEILKQSQEWMGPYCKSCPVCNGKACKNHIPGPGAKGTGTVAIKNYDAWQAIEINMDTICENKKIDTSLSLFGKTFKYPFFAGPVGAVAMHYSDKYNDMTYNNVLVSACKKAGIAAFTGDGLNPDIMMEATKIIAANEGVGVPTIKPWAKEVVQKKFDLAKQCGSFAVAMDIDAAGLPFLKNCTPPAGRKSVQELKEIIDQAPVPFIVKGVMSVKGAMKALEAGASGIVVSNHGGRVLDGTPSTASVLEEIADAVDGKMKIFVDGGIRNGVDVFKALALGADAVLIARPFVNMIYGAQEAGVQALVDQLGAELKDTMEMCGANSLADIRKDMVRK